MSRMVRILFIADVVLINLHGTGAWATGSIRFYHWVHRHQAVILAIYIQIEAEIINMLVCSTHDIVIDKRAVARVIFPLLTSSDVVFLLATALCGRFSQVHIISTDVKGIACTCQVVWQVCQLFIQWVP